MRGLEAGKVSCRVGLVLTVLQTLGLTVSVTTCGAPLMSRVLDAYLKDRKAVEL